MKCVFPVYTQMPPFCCAAVLRTALVHLEWHYAVLDVLSYTVFIYFKEGVSYQSAQVLI